MQVAQHVDDVRHASRVQRPEGRQQALDVATQCGNSILCFVIELLLLPEEAAEGAEDDGEEELKAPPSAPDDEEVSEMTLWSRDFKVQDGVALAMRARDRLNAWVCWRRATVLWHWPVTDDDGGSYVFCDNGGPDGGIDISISINMNLKHSAGACNSSDW